LRFEGLRTPLGSTETTRRDKEENLLIIEKLDETKTANIGEKHQSFDKVQRNLVVNRSSLTMSDGVILTVAETLTVTERARRFVL